MDDLKLMTVRALRELAKQHLGPGYSKLKTKAELIAELAKKLAHAKPHEKPHEPKAPSPAAPQPAVAIEGARPTPEATPAPMSAAASPPAPQPAASKSPAPAAPTPPEPVAPPPPAPVAPPPPAPAAPPVTGEGALAKEDEEALTAKAAAAPQQAPEPASPAPRIKSQAELDLENEHLGELPQGYGASQVVLLARDPHTLWVFWDFDAQTARQARAGLVNPRVVLRLFDGDRLVRELDVALEARSWYLHHVTPGGQYRVELCFAGERGQLQRVGHRSNAAAAPREGPSSVVADRFVTLPWQVPLTRAAPALHAPHVGEPFAERDRDALTDLAEAGLISESVTEGRPGEVEITRREVRGLGGSELWTHTQRRVLPGASRPFRWTSSGAQ